MKTQTLQHFQTDGETWVKRAEKGKLPAVIDPGDLKGRKNLYIDTIQKLALQKALGTETREFMVDFGCGTGRFSDLLAERCEFLLGLEITQPMLLLAKNKCPNPNIGFVLFDGLDLPIKAGRVDVVTSVNVLQYVTDDLELTKVLSELQRSLKTGGRLICIEQVTKNPRRWQRDEKTYLRIFEQNDFKRIADYPIRKGHCPLLYPIYFGLIPKRFFKALGRFEIFSRRVLWHSLWDYQDHLFVMKKT
ncbi:MAG: class I SAM-dependent methyltransferase [Candidatus Zixiibacteriota bacterium]